MAARSGAKQQLPAILIETCDSGPRGNMTLERSNSPFSLANTDIDSLSLNSVILPRTLSELSEMESSDSVSTFNTLPPQQSDRSASTLDLRSSSRTRMFKEKTRNFFSKMKRNARSSGDLQQNLVCATTRIDTSSLQDIYKLKSEKDNSRLRLQDSSKADKRASTLTLFGEESQEKVDSSMKSLSHSIPQADIEVADAPEPIQASVNPFGKPIKGEELEDVYKAALGCFLTTSVSTRGLEEGERVDSYLMKAFEVDKHRHERLLKRAQLEQKPELKLLLKVREASQLIGRKGHGKSDPYCIAAVVKEAQVRNPQRDLVEWRQDLGELMLLQTEVQECTLNPEWNQDFSIDIDSSDNTYLALECWDSEDRIPLKKIKGIRGFINYLKDKRGHNDFLGKTFVPLKSVPMDGSDSWYDLQSHRGRQRGRVHLALRVDVKMHGVPHDVALERYEQLFQVLCTYESQRSRYSSDPQLAEELKKTYKWTKDWSVEMSPRAEKVLQMFCKRHGISALEEAIIQLKVLIKYHQKYRVAFSAFQSIYTTIIAEQDKLQTSEGSTANAAAASSDQSSNNWQAVKLVKCTKLLHSEIELSIQNHLINLDLKSTIEVELFQLRLCLLRSLYQVEPYLATLDQSERSLSEYVEKIVQQSCKYWFKLLMKRAMEDSQNRLLAFLGTVKTLGLYLSNARDVMAPVFREVGVNYFEVSYLQLEGLLADNLEEVLTQQSNESSHYSYILYLTLREFKGLAIHTSESAQEKLRLTQYHLSFKNMVNVWISLATQRYKDGVMKATTQFEEEPVTEGAQYSSLARNLIDLIVVVCSFWKNLDWPNPTESFQYLMKLVQETCSGTNCFVEQVCKNIKLHGFFNITPDGFTVTKKLCIALNDIEQVRRGLKDLPDFIQWDLSMQLLNEVDGSGATANRELQELLDKTDETILLTITSLTVDISEKMRPSIKKGMRSVVHSACKQDFYHMSTPLMEYLMQSLQQLHSSVFESVFKQLLIHIWNIVMEKMYKHVQTSRDKTTSENLFALLNMLHDFFKGDVEKGRGGLDEELLIAHKLYRITYNTLELRIMSTEEVISLYYEDLAKYQAKAMLTRGSLTIMVTYIKERQRVDIQLVRASELPGVNVKKTCDAYFKVALVPEELFKMERLKSKVYKNNRDPVMDAEFHFGNVQEKSLKEAGTLLLVEVYSHDRLGSHTPIGVVVVKCSDIPVFSDSIPEDSELASKSPTKLALVLPITKPCDCEAFKELRERSNDPRAAQFVKRIKKLAFTPQKQGKIIQKALLNGKRV